MYSIMGSSTPFWAVYPILGAMYPIPGSEPYPRAQVPHPRAVNPVLEARGPGGSGDLLSRLRMPLPGRHRAGDASTTVASAPQQQATSVFQATVDNHSLLCSLAGPMLIAEMTVTVIIVICPDG